MPRVAQIHYTPLRSSLVNLPISIYGPLLERSVRPQRLGVVLTPTPTSSSSSSPPPPPPCHVGWTGMASATSLAHLSHRDGTGYQTVEIDPQYATSLGLKQGDLVRHSHPLFSLSLSLKRNQVEIGLLHDLQKAVSVATEPFGSDDWEIIVTPSIWALTCNSCFFSHLARNHRHPTSRRHFFRKSALLTLDRRSMCGCWEGRG
jgi:peroxin-1